MEMNRKHTYKKMNTKEKAEKEKDAQAVRDMATGLRMGIDNFKEDYCIDMTEEIIEYLRSQK